MTGTIEGAMKYPVLIFYGIRPTAFSNWGVEQKHSQGIGGTVSQSSSDFQESGMKKLSCDGHLHPESELCMRASSKKLN